MQIQDRSLFGLLFLLLLLQAPMPAVDQAAAAQASAEQNGSNAGSNAAAADLALNPTVGTAATPAPSSSPIVPVPNNGQIPLWLWLSLILGASGLLWAVLKRSREGSTSVGSQDEVASTSSDTSAAVPSPTINPATGTTATEPGQGIATAIATPNISTPELDLEVLGARSNSGEDPLDSALENNPSPEPTAFSPVTQLPAQNQPPALETSILAASVVTSDTASSAESAVARATTEEAAIDETTVETPAMALGATAEAAAAQLALDAAPRSSGLDPAAIAAATGGTIGAAAIAQTFFVENPNIDDTPRSAEPAIPSAAIPVNPIAATLAATNTVIENSADNIAASDDASNPALGTAMATGAILSATDLDGVDQTLPDLPGGYGESRIVLMARDPQWAYAYWDVPEDHKQALRDQGGQQLALRLYDVTDLDLSQSRPHSVQQYGLEEMTRDWYLPIPVSDRDYRAEIGYTTVTGTWLVLAQSNALRVPPVFPSDEIVDQFVTIPWEEELPGKTIALPGKAGLGPIPIHQQMYNMGMPGTAESRIAGSIGGDSSFIFPSGIGMNLPQELPSTTAFGSGMGLNMSGVGMNMSGVGMNMSGVGMNMSGIEMNMFGVGMNMSGVGMNMSGIGMNMSGVGFGSFQPPTNKPRNFWLVADAELIVYGATEPDANLTIDGEPVQLNPDGTFRIQLSFQDGQLRFPIMAVAADGEQMRNITMNFNRITPVRRTNTKAEAQDEWPNA
jgi:hypothetical protein